MAKLKVPHQINISKDQVWPDHLKGDTAGSDANNKSMIDAITAGLPGVGKSTTQERINQQTQTNVVDIINAFNKLSSQVNSIVTSQVSRFISGSSDVTVKLATNTWTDIIPNRSLGILAPSKHEQGDSIGIFFKTQPPGGEHVSSSIGLPSVTELIENPLYPGTFVSGSVGIAPSFVTLRWTWLGVGPDAAWRLTTCIKEKE
jgi:hypothetical protein